MRKLRLDAGELGLPLTESPAESDVIPLSSQAAIRFWSLLVDAVISLLLWVPSLIMQMMVEPVHRAFSCNDPSLKYPYRGYKFPYFLLILLCFSVSCVIIFSIEYVTFSRAHDYLDIGDSRANTRWRGRRLPLLEALSRCSPLIVILIIIELLKNCFAFVLGFMRPHFLVLCAACPNCSSTGSLCVASCSPTDPTLLREARLTFPSGHAAVAMACAVYTSYFICVRARHGFHVPAAFVSVILYAGAIYLGIDTVRTHMHHLQDVMGGFLLGGSIAWAVAYMQLRQTSHLWSKEAGELEKTST